MFVFVSVRSRDQCRSFFTYLFQYALSFLLSFASSESVRSHLTDDGYMDKFVWVFFLLSVDLIFVKKKKRGKNPSQTVRAWIVFLDDSCDGSST